MTPIPVASHDQNSHVAPHFDHLGLRNAKVLLMMLTPELVASHYQKGHVATAFHFPDLRNTVVSLITPKASHDTDSGTNCII